MPGETMGPSLEELGLSKNNLEDSESKELDIEQDAKYDITLDSLMVDGDGPKTEYYRSVVELASAQKTPYAEMWDPSHEKNSENERSERLKKRLEMLSGQIVLDLGSGGKWKTSEDESYEVRGPAFLKALDNAGVEDVRYIGIDPFIRAYEKPNQDLELAQELGLQTKNDIAPSLHNQDMLVALSSMRENCQVGERKVSITVNGIDDDIVEPEGIYHEMLLDEMKRVLPEGGLIFSRGSSVSNLINNDSSFQAVEIFEEPKYEGDSIWGVWKKL